MLRRVLPVVAATAVVLVPSTASAAPAQAPVESYRSYSYAASVQGLVLPDGRQASAYLGEGRGSRLKEGWGALSLDVWSEYACGDEICTEGSTVLLELTADQVHFDRSLRIASVEGVSIDIPDPAPQPDPWPGEEDPVAGGEDPYAGGEAPWLVEDPSVVEDPAGSDEPPAGEEPVTGDEEPWPGGEDPWPGDEDPWAGDEEPGTGGEDPYAPAPATTYTLSLVFTGIGAIDRTAGHSTICGDGGRTCQAIRVEATRNATARMTLDDAVVESSTGSLFFGHGIDAAAPVFRDEAS